MNISVIIPIKNRAHLLAATLQSILSQTRFPKEIILVDDNSEDNLVEAILPFKEKIILLKATKPGPGAARNLGFQKATGEYVQFFDSDDLMTQNKLEVQAKLLEETGADFVYGPFVKAREVESLKLKAKSTDQSSLSTLSIQPSAFSWKQLDVIMNYNPLPTKLPMLNYVARGWCPITQASLFRRDFVEKIGGWREDVFTHEDLDFWFRVAETNPKSTHTNQCCVLYRQHGNQLTDEMTKKINYAKNHLVVLQNWGDKIRTTDWLTKHYFKAKQYGSAQFLLNNNISDYEEYLENAYKLSSLIFRLNNKKERFITQTSWERMNGVNKDQSQYNNFITKF